jgi:hypothetical protein
VVSITADVGWCPELVLCSLFLLIRWAAQLPAVRQKLHLSPCSDSSGRLSVLKSFHKKLDADQKSRRSNADCHTVTAEATLCRLELPIQKLTGAA